MRGPGRAGAEDVAGDRQVRADDAVLVEGHALPAEDVGDHKAKAGKEKGAGPLSRFGHLAGPTQPQADVKHAVR